jgi:hypothetical protein
MQWIIDHLAAFVISATVILLLAVIHVRGQSSAIETVQFGAAKNQINLLSEVIEQDFGNIGAGLLFPIEAQLFIDSVSTVKQFAFWSRTDRNSPTPQRIEYRWRVVGQVVMNGGQSVDAYELERRVGTTIPVSGAGQIMGNTITHFSITPRDNRLQRITSLDLTATRRLDVSIRVASPLGTGEIIEEARWERQIRPPSLDLATPGGSLILQNP